MAASKYKCSLRKKLNSELYVITRRLKKENSYLKKTLADLSHQHHAERNRLVEKFLCLESMKHVSCQLLFKEDNLTDNGDGTTPSCAKDLELIINKLMTISNKCQDLESKVAEQPVSASSEDTFSSDEVVSELKNQLKDALEKNKQWLDYDQQREAYVKAILAKMLWLERQLNEANQCRLQQHNEDHSNEEKLKQMQEHYEKLLQKVTDELRVRREQVEMTHRNLIIAQNWCKEKDKELEELKQQLQVEKAAKENTKEDKERCDDEKQAPEDESGLQVQLKKEKRKSANFELQANLIQRFMLNRHYEDQEKIAELMRQIKISSQDLEDERRDCSYLKNQMIKLVKMLQNAKGHGRDQLKRDQQDHCGYEGVQLASHSSSESLESTSHSDVLNESFLECPSCQVKYAASQHHELLNHLETCLN